LQAGGAPLLIPPLLDAATLRTIYERLDGVLLAGGGDIAPNHYGDQPHERLGTIDPPRDLTELRLARWAAAEGKPLLGICRGVQLINVALGGSLYQDIPSQIDTTMITICHIRTKIGRFWHIRSRLLLTRAWPGCWEQPI
jgi:Predicted glutamine amidotransferases